MLGKRLFENSACNIHSFPAKLKQLNRNINIAEDLCAIGGDRSQSYVKCPKVVSAWGHTKRRGQFPSWDNHSESEGCAAVENIRCSDDLENEEPLAAVPLRCTPPDVPSACDDLHAKQGESDGDEQESDDRDNAYSGNDTWKSDLEKLTGLIARAEEYIQLSNAKYSTVKKVLPTESKFSYQSCSSDFGVLHNGTPVGESMPIFQANEQETMAGQNLAESFSRQSSAEGLSEIKMKIKDKVSKACQGKNLSRLEVKMEGDDEICVLSPDEWNTFQYPTCISHINLVDEEVAEIRDENTCIVNQTDLINLSIVPQDHPQAIRVRALLKLFEEQYAKLLEELRGPSEEKCACPHLVVATRLKADGMFLSYKKPFGHIPGVHVGDEFRFRVELSIIGLHRQFVAGIDYVVLHGKKFATSVINSGRYENEAKALDVLIYSGQGGNQKIGEKSVDQKLERGNLALKNSMEMRYPVRVTYKRKSVMGSQASGVVGSESNVAYVYDGLYTVNRMWQERNQNGKLAFKFELHRMPDQPRILVQPLRHMKTSELHIVDDISQGKEKLFIPAVNGLDDDGYPSFTYVTNMVYPTWYQRVEPVGCNCINGCSDSQQCPCVLKNGGEFPFNENGKLIRAKPKALVHECGASCKCPPSCMNRVSQHGPRCQLEIFKTTARGWGVRSRDSISSGSFICEYIGELLRDKDAEQRIGSDEYLFDITDDKEEGVKGGFQGFFGSKSNDDGFAIDAAKFGNIGRFINHSCCPNLFAQKVICNDERIPHIMFFAGRNIPPLQELSYDYNYKIDRVCDANGNIKMKDCFCGSRKCIGRMY